MSTIAFADDPEGRLGAHVREDEAVVGVVVSFGAHRLERLGPLHSVRQLELEREANGRFQFVGGRVLRCVAHGGFLA